jgi:hypothetical protein
MLKEGVLKEWLVCRPWLGEFPDQNCSGGDWTREKRWVGQQRVVLYSKRAVAHRHRLSERRAGGFEAVLAETLATVDL